MLEPSSVIVSAVGLALVFTTSIPAFLTIFRDLRTRRGRIDDNLNSDGLYEDKDGLASEESQKGYSTIIQRVIVLAGTTIGFLLSIAVSVINTTEAKNLLLIESWITSGCWIFLVIQSLNLFHVHSSLAVFRLGVYGAAACLLVIAVICVDNALKFQLFDHGSPTVHIVLTAIQLAVAILSLIGFLCLPRRPAVFDNGRMVDGEATVSFLSRYTFAWASPVLSIARDRKGLELEQLPYLPHAIRSDSLQQRFNTGFQSERLWKTMVWTFRWAFLKQLLLVVTVSITQFGPQYAMYHLLKLLEVRSEGASVAMIAWAWVFGLGFFIILSSCIESWLFWVVWAGLGTPIRSLLSALVFMKATRRKDVKGVQKAKAQVEKDAMASDIPVVNESSGMNGEDTAPGAGKTTEDDEDENFQKSRQSTINLVGVDAKRIADFCSFSYLFPGTVVQLIISMWFLTFLIGWKPLLAGIICFALTTPLNILLSKYYNAAQGDLMKVRDQKMAVVTEALQGIRQIKFSALERQWQARIGERRKLELETLWRVFKLDTGLITCWILGPVLLSAVTLTVYALLHGTLSPSVAFTTIAVLGQIEVTLAVIPELSTDAIDAWVSINRIEEYLKAPEKEDCITQSDSIAFDNASIAWPSDSQESDPDRFILRDINIRFPSKELSVISGKTGSGKSLMLAAILGEVDKISGTISVPKTPPVGERHDKKATKGNWIIDSSIAFVAQIPWIENATIKDNILFGLPFDAGRYKKVISVCALVKDFEMFPDGELTDIGANGINLSGGQRWRVSFARALYSRAGILILDDIFSAVDTHVGRQLFEEALTGELGVGRTRILVTHHVGLALPRTKYSVLLGEGTVAHAGFVADLQRTGSLADILKQEEEEKEQDEEALQEDERNDNGLQKIMSRFSERSIKVDDSEGIDSKGKAQTKKFTEDEKRETGSIKLGVYKEYFSKSGGFKIWIGLVCLYLTYMALILGRSYWVNIWTRSYRTESESFLAQGMVYQHVQRKHSSSDELQLQNSTNIGYYLGIYIGLSVTIVLFGSIRYFTTFIASLRASKILFENLSYTVLRTPLRWLDTVPVGRILNRFTADFNIVDSRISMNFGFFLYKGLELFGIMIAGFIVSPFMIVFAIALIGFVVYIAFRYLYGAREVKRLESNSRSPIFEQFGSALAGVGTIRAFDKAEEYIGRFFTKVDNNALAIWHIWLFNRWMALRLNMIGACFAIIVSAIIVSAKNIDASLAGFALAFALQYTSAIIWVVRSYANLELDMNAVERIVEYTRLDTEDQGGHNPPAGWPTEGSLEVDGVVAGYASDLPPVLKGLSFSIAKNQRVGVVGRTGAGKSSLTLTLFRFLEAREGSIHIDGIDISKINLHDLRSRLAIIPQDPVLFSGTVRSNLDAFNEHTDAELRDALERVHLIRGTGLASRDESTEASEGSASAIPATIDTNTNAFNSLSSRISEGGLNLSQGQRQLLCLARAIVSRPKIMVLDEATSAVDMATDVLIQRSIREEFGDSTLLVIAHRLSTIADFDKILVMSDGKAVEYDSPRTLLEKEGGIFREMVGTSGEVERLREIILGVGVEDVGEGSSRSGGGGGGGEASSSSGKSGRSNEGEGESGA